MGRYKINEYRSIPETFIPSTSVGSFVNKGGLDSWGIGWGFGGIIPLMTGLALSIEVSAWFAFLPAVWAIMGLLLLVACARRYTMTGYRYEDQVLPVEQAYAKLSPKRQAQYKHLVLEAYKNGESGKSNRKIIELLETYAELDYMVGETSRISKFIDDELEIARKVAKDVREMEPYLES